MTNESRSHREHFRSVFNLWIRLQVDQQVPSYTSLQFELLCRLETRSLPFLSFFINVFVGSRELIKGRLAVV